MSGHSLSVDHEPAKPNEPENSQTKQNTKRWLWRIFKLLLIAGVVVGLVFGNTKIAKYVNKIESRLKKIPLGACIVGFLAVSLPRKLVPIVYYLFPIGTLTEVYLAYRLGPEHGAFVFQLIKLQDIFYFPILRYIFSNAAIDKSRKKLNIDHSNSSSNNTVTATTTTTATRAMCFPSDGDSQPWTRCCSRARSCCRLQHNRTYKIHTTQHSTQATQHKHTFVHKCTNAQHTIAPYIIAVSTHTHAHTYTHTHTHHVGCDDPKKGHFLRIVLEALHVCDTPCCVVCQIFASCS